MTVMIQRFRWNRRAARCAPLGEPYAIPDAEFDGATPSKPSRARREALYVKGPIPWDWMAKAAALPGKTTEVGLALWLLAGMHGRRVVTLGTQYLSDLGVNRWAKHRALAALESAGLISVRRAAGALPVVTLLTPLPQGTDPAPEFRPEAGGTKSTKC